MLVAAKVPVDVVAETTIEADAQGGYSMVINTSGIPDKEYRIEGAGDVKTMRLRGSAQGSHGDEEPS